MYDEINGKAHNSVTRGTAGRIARRLGGSDAVTLFNTRHTADFPMERLDLTTLISVAQYMWEKHNRYNGRAQYVKAYMRTYDHLCDTRI